MINFMKKARRSDQKRESDLTTPPQMHWLLDHSLNTNSLNLDYQVCIDTNQQRVRNTNKYEQLCTGTYIAT